MMRWTTHFGPWLQKIVISEKGLRMAKIARREEQEERQERMEGVYAQLRKIRSLEDRVSAFLSFPVDVQKCRFKTSGLRIIDRFSGMATNDIEYSDLVLRGAKIPSLSRRVRLAA